MAVKFILRRDYAVHTGGTKFYEVAIVTIEGWPGGDLAAAIFHYAPYKGQNGFDLPIGQVDVNLSFSTHSAKQVGGSKIQEKKKRGYSMWAGKTIRTWEMNIDEFTNLKDLEILLRIKYGISKASEIITHLISTGGVGLPLNPDQVGNLEKTVAAAVINNPSFYGDYANDEDFGTW